MRWGIGIIPQPVRRLVTISAQAKRDAAVAELNRQRAEAAAAPPRHQLPLQGEASAKEPIAKPKPIASPPSPARAQIKPLSEMDELRLSLARKITAVLEHWRKCPARLCRRHHRCASPALECTDLARGKPSTPAQDAAAMAHLRRALARRRAELEGMNMEK